MRSTRRSADGLHADAFVDTQISRPSLTLNVTGPSTATVDERIQFRIEVVNSGDQPLLNITVTDRFDAGLEHTEKLASPIQKVIERLEPGGNAQFAVGFLVRRAGQICHVVEAGRRTPIPCGNRSA